MSEKTKKKGQKKNAKGGKGGSGGSNASGGKMVTLGNLNLTFNLTIPPELITENDPEKKIFRYRISKRYRISIRKKGIMGSNRNGIRE